MADSTSTRVVGYIRVSTADQAEHGASLAVQQSRLVAYAAAMGLELVAIDVDAGVSAATLARPGLQRALGRLALGEATGLLVAKLDRLTRSVRDLGTLLDGPLAHAELLSVADSIDTRTAGGRLVLNVLTSVAQWEREAVSERTTETMAQLRREGCRVGSVPLGRRVAGRRADGRTVLEDDQAGQAALGRMRELRDEGRSYRAIAEALQAEGHKPARSQTWQPTSVRKALMAA